MTMDKLRQFHKAAMGENDYEQAQTIFTMQRWARMTMDKLTDTFHNAAMGENDYGQA